MQSASYLSMTDEQCVVQIPKTRIFRNIGPHVVSVCRRGASGVEHKFCLARCQRWSKYHWLL